MLRGSVNGHFRTSTLGHQKPARELEADEAGTGSLEGQGLGPGSAGLRASCALEPVRQDAGRGEGDGRLVGWGLHEVRPPPELSDRGREPRELINGLLRGPGEWMATGGYGIDAAPVQRGLWEEPADAASLLRRRPMEVRAAEVANGAGAIQAPSYGEDRRRGL